MSNGKLFIKGMTYGWNCTRGAYREPYAFESLQKLKETGSEWIALAFYTRQSSIYATEIPFEYGFTVTDRDIEQAIKQAKSLGLKVCLKPVVNCKDGIWRAHIGFPDEPEAAPYWDAWFRSYGDFLCHYAELAEELGCEMFCIGCEMVKTEAKSAHWGQIIERIRQTYRGPIVYNANHGSEEKIAWFDLVDVIGTSAYYPVANKPGDGVRTMIANWLPVREKMARLHARFGKPVVFMEIGCRSALGCATMPWDFQHTDLPASETEQANFYSSALQVFWNEPWFSGFFWWDWSVKLYPLAAAKTNTGFDIYGKKAEHILREWYKKS